MADGRGAGHGGSVRLGGWRALPRQVAIVAGGVGIYFGTRGVTASDPAPALEHAEELMALEHDLGIAWEGALQELVVGSGPLITLVNWIYIWGHWPVIAVVLGWLAFSHPDIYLRTRNAMIASGLIGIVCFIAYPLAPPRLAGLGLVDTVTEQSNAYRVLQPPAFVNQYAAMPSLHVGWDLLMGVAVATAATGVVLRVVGVLMPVAMVAAVLLTANHYILDVVAGAAVALAGLALAVRFERLQLTRRQTAAAARREVQPAEVIELPAPRDRTSSGDAAPVSPSAPPGSAPDKERVVARCLPGPR